MNERRAQKIKSVAERRQPNLTIILENVHDIHNLGAVMRSADSVGVKELFLLTSDPSLMTKKKIKVGKRTSAGTRRWIDVWAYDDVDKCFADVKSRYEKIFATHLASDSVSLYELKLSESVALLFGNEHAGVTAAALAHCDGNFIIPQVGMVQSLNISVAAAVTLYEAYRQRNEKGMYTDNLTQSAAEQQALFENFVERTDKSYDSRFAKKIISQ